MSAFFSSPLQFVRRSSELLTPPVSEYTTYVCTPWRDRGIDSGGEHLVFVFVVKKVNKEKLSAPLYTNEEAYIILSSPPNKVIGSSLIELPVVSLF